MYLQKIKYIATLNIALSLILAPQLTVAQGDATLNCTLKQTTNFVADTYMMYESATTEADCVTACEAYALENILNWADDDIYTDISWTCQLNEEEIKTVTVKENSVLSTSNVTNEASVTASSTEDATIATETTTPVATVETVTIVSLDDRTKERITNLAANVSSRLDVAVERQQNITTRLQSRIDKLSTAGLDTTNAVAILASANASLAIAEQNMSTIDLEVNNVVNAENPIVAWQDVKSSYIETRDHLHTAQSEIRATIEALKLAANTERSNNESIVIETTETMPPCPTDLPNPGETGYDPMQYVDCLGSEVVDDEQVIMSETATTVE